MTKTVVIENTQTVATEDNQGDVEFVIVQPEPNTVAISLPETSVVEVALPAPISVVVDASDTSVVEVQHTVENTVAVEQVVPVVVEIVARGPQGVPGDIGGGGNAVSIIGYPVHMIDGEPDDLLSFTGSEWLNKPQSKVTDGGNF